MLSGSVYSQTKSWEHNAYVGIGYVNGINDDDNYHFAIHLGYGINHYFTEHWSLMPGVGIRLKLSSGNSSSDGNNNSSCTFLDIPILAQYHLSPQGSNGFVFEAGPVFSFLVNNDAIHYRSLDDGEIKTVDIFKSFDVGVRPAVYYQLGKVRLGVQAHFGLLDIRKEYPRLEDSYHFQDIMFVASLHF